MMASGTSCQFSRSFAKECEPIGKTWSCPVTVEESDASYCRFHRDGIDPDIIIDKDVNAFSEEVPVPMVGASIGDLIIKGPISADESLLFYNCNISRVHSEGNDAESELSLKFLQSKVNGVDLSDMGIEGDIKLDSCEIRSLNLNKIRLSGDISICNTIIDGEVQIGSVTDSERCNISNCIIKKELKCWHSKFDSFHLGSSTVVGDLKMENVETESASISHATIEGSIHLDGAKFGGDFGIRGVIGGDIKFQHGEVERYLSLPCKVMGNVNIGSTMYDGLSVKRLNLNGTYRGALEVANVTPSEMIWMKCDVGGPVSFREVKLGSDAEIQIPSPDVGGVQFIDCVFGGGTISQSSDSNSTAVEVDDCRIQRVNFKGGAENFFQHCRIRQPRFDQFSFSTHRTALRDVEFDIVTVDSSEQLAYNKLWQQYRRSLRGFIAFFHCIDGVAEHVATADQISLTTFAEAILEHPYEIKTLPDGKQKVVLTINGEKTITQGMEISDFLSALMVEWDSSINELEQQWSSESGPSQQSLDHVDISDSYSELLSTPGFRRVLKDIANQMNSTDSPFHYRHVPPRWLSTHLRGRFREMISRTYARYEEGLNPDAENMDEILELLARNPQLTAAISDRMNAEPRTSDNGAHPLEIAFPELSSEEFEFSTSQIKVNDAVQQTFSSDKVQNTLRYIADVLEYRPDVRPHFGSAVEQHENNEETHQPQSPEIALLREIDTAGEVSTLTPGEKEETYLRARAAADNSGRSYVASQFYVREKRAKGRRHRSEVLSPFRSDPSITNGDTFREKIQSAFTSLKYSGEELYHYLSNVSLRVVTGYGERPGRVILISAAIIGLFWSIYAFIVPGLSILNALLRSLEAFIALVLPGSFPVESKTAHLIAQIEGFFGAFMIALFVFTLTRSLHR